MLKSTENDEISFFAIIVIYISSPEEDPKSELTCITQYMYSSKTTSSYRDSLNSLFLVEDLTRRKIIAKQEK